MSAATGQTAVHPSVTTGLAMMFVAMLVSPLIDIFSKLAASSISSTQIAAARFVLQTLFMLPFVMWRGKLRSITLQQTGFHVIRGALIALSMISFVTALRVMAVADAIAIFFVEPVILTVLSSIFLKEKIGWRRYTACGVGFLGAMLIIRPSFEVLGYVALLPVVTAVCVAIFALMTRALAHKEDPFAMQLQTGFWGAVVCGGLLVSFHGSDSGLFDVALPSPTVAVYMLGVGATATFAGILAVYAYRAAPASVVAPIQYFEIVSATIFGWLVFSDLPDAMKWLGIAIIIASGLYILWRESHFASRPVSESAGSKLTP